MPRGIQTAVMRLGLAAALMGSTACPGSKTARDTEGSASGESTGAPTDGDGPADADATGEGSANVDSDGGSCLPGTQGCPCDLDSGCEPGLVCTADTCVVPSSICGDGEVEGDEQCDLGPDLDDEGECKTDCTFATCGDGWVGPNETCDDGNLNDHDECTNACQPPVCGDGALYTGEECDDGNDEDGDACLTGCIQARCGDGIVWQGVEECDDGNSSNSDACINGCRDARCGDGHRWSGREQCDGNSLGGQTCESQGFASGDLDCDDECTFDTSGCMPA